MVNTQYIENLIMKKGLKKSFIAEKLGMSIQTLHRKITNNGDFFTNEVMTLCDVLEIPSCDVEKIFFVRK